jgi:hypothetical protein
MRWIAVPCIPLALAAASTTAMGQEGTCLVLAESGAQPDDPPAAGGQPLLTENQCEATRYRELRVPLLEVPQEEEDPIALSLGAKSSGLTLRLKIPFSL